MYRMIRADADTSIKNMNTEAMLANLHALDRKLGEHEMHGRIDLFGGAVMCLGLNARETTHDIDGLFAPSVEMHQLIAEVAQELHLPSDWLNDGVKGFVSPEGEVQRYLGDSFKNLDIFMATPQYLFAMKCLSCRNLAESSTELSDIKFLINYLNINSVDEAEEIILNYYPANAYKPKTHYMLEELFEDIE